MGTPEDFYEDDEPVDEIRALFEYGEKGVTAPPKRAETAYVSFSETFVGPIPLSSTTTKELVDH